MDGWRNRDRDRHDELIVAFCGFVNAHKKNVDHNGVNQLSCVLFAFIILWLLEAVPCMVRMTLSIASSFLSTVVFLN